MVGSQEESQDDDEEDDSDSGEASGYMMAPEDHLESRVEQNLRA